MGRYKMNKEMDDINITDEFYFFLNWLVEKKDFSASEIAEVTRYYWKYEKQWKEYISEVEERINKTEIKES